MKEKRVLLILISLLVILSAIYILTIPVVNFSSLEDCQSACMAKGYSNGNCLWSMEADGGVSLGGCLIEKSRHCGNEGQCNCYCYQEGSKECIVDSDCVVFGETGDCNCGCYNKDNLPSVTGGECFCLAPTSCKCVNGQCEGIFGEECAKEGEQFSFVYKDQYPEHCCENLTEWHSGFDTRISIADECYETGLLAGSPIGTCINCGNEICEDIENPCNCPGDCEGKNKSGFLSIEEFCQSEGWVQTFSEACEEIIKDFPICKLC